MGTFTLHAIYVKILPCHTGRAMMFGEVLRNHLANFFKVFARVVLSSSTFGLFSKLFY